MDITPDFLRKLKADPEATIRATGTEPEPGMVDAIKAMDIDSLIKFLETFPNSPVTTTAP